ncbi:MAG: NADH:flavin oxidoreductase, partial [Armatimonadetes bacterium]|nr:NADH:flavin oxidoreductase [Armatimonadota bacterium]
MATSRLFTPGHLGRLEIRNRIVRSATLENMATPDGLPTHDLLTLYTALARGGAGLLITGFSYVNLAGKAYLRQNGAHSDDVIPGWRRITAQVHAHGAVIAMQLSHGGRQVSLFRGPADAPVAPSPLPNLVTMMRPREMTDEEIWHTVADFGAAAGRAREAGFDAVQIQAAHGYLISAFLSPLTNRRSDAWGGDEERRFRFLKEVYGAVRRAVGSDFPVLVKLNVDDFLPGGVSPAEALRTARRLALLGADGLELSGGMVETIFFAARGQIPVGELVRDFPLPRRVFHRVLAAFQRRRVRFREAYFLPHVRRVRAVVPTPLILVGGMRDPGQMEEILTAGHADFISLARPLIRQPYLPHLWEDGLWTASRCEACNRCVAAVHR